MKKKSLETSEIVVLASASPRRRQLLKQAGIRFRAVPSRYCEGKAQGDPARFALHAAQAKAHEVAGRLKQPAWVLGADTVVAQGRHIFGKPASRQVAEQMLRKLSGQEHVVVTGVSLEHSRTGKKITWVEKTYVTMRILGTDEIKAYLDSGEWHDKAGAYGIQGLAGTFVTKVKGCYFNVVGLPLGAVCEKLRNVRGEA